MITLAAVRFQTVTPRPIDFRIYVADLAYRDGGGNVVRYRPSNEEVSTAVSYLVRTWPIDPSQLRISYRYTRISQNPPLPTAPRYDDTHPIEVDPPIAGYPQWDTYVYQDENIDIDTNGLVWLALDNNSWVDCTGGAFNFRIPLFWAGRCGPTVAHEAAHVFPRPELGIRGRGLVMRHAGNAHGEDGSNPDYPGAHGQVEAHSFGFDIFYQRAIPPDLGEPHA